MPFIKPPNMIPNIDEDNVQEEFNLKQIDAPMPEAPWIRRCEHGIRFTDEMQDEELEGYDEEDHTPPEEEKKANEMEATPPMPKGKEGKQGANKQKRAVGHISE